MLSTQYTTPGGKNFTLLTETNEITQFMDKFDSALDNHVKYTCPNTFEQYYFDTANMTGISMSAVKSTTDEKTHE